MLVTDREFLGRGCGNTGTKDTVQVGVGVSKGTRKKQWGAGEGKVRQTRNLYQWAVFVRARVVFSDILQIYPCNNAR